MKAAVLGAVLAVALPVLAGAAWAQDRPPTIPLRDVDVTYLMAQNANGALEQRMRWLVAEQKLRVDPPTQGLWMLMDYRTRRMSVVREKDRHVLDMDGAASPLPAQPGLSGQGFQRRGTDQVAGLACTEWQTMDSTGAATLACITADGVLLRARQNAGGQWRTLIEAARVSYAAQDATAFRAPDGFQHVKAPAPDQVGR